MKQALFCVFIGVSACLFGIGAASNGITESIIKNCETVGKFRYENTVVACTCTRAGAEPDREQHMPKLKHYLKLAAAAVYLLAAITTYGHAYNAHKADPSLSTNINERRQFIGASFCAVFWPLYASVKLQER